MEPRSPSLSSVRTARKDVEALERSGEEGPKESADLRQLASGGYNDIWLVSRPLGGARQYVLRKPKEDAMLPDQIRNEVAWLTFVRKKLPDVPVPEVYQHSIQGRSSGDYFIAEEFITGERLDVVWKTYDEPTKMAVARQIAEVIVKLGEITFDGIGGLLLNHTLGPTVEGTKLFKGRDKFHSSSCYNIGPYQTTGEYVLACYDKEIYYYSHASDDDIDQDFFTKVTKEDFIQTLRNERQAFSENSTFPIVDEPFVLVHGDLHGRNIMMKDGRISAILDWEFAGSYPLSELLGGSGVDVLEMETEEDTDEDFKWSDIIVNLAGEVARLRGWNESRVLLLVGEGNPELQKARVEMVPEDCYDGDESEDEVQ